MKRIPVLAALVVTALAGCHSERWLAAPLVPGATDAIYFAGQPDRETLAAWRDDGIDVVINLRPPEEMTWDQRTAVEALGLEYHVVPIASSGGSFSQDSIARISQIVNANPDREVVVHCRSGNRASAWYAVHLVEHEGLSLEAALEQARATGLTSSALEQRIRDYLAPPGG